MQFIPALIEIENELHKANDLLLAANSNAALTSLNAALSNLKFVREKLEEGSQN